VAHEKVKADREAVAQAIVEDEHYLVLIRKVIAEMQLSEHGSANRQLAIRHLEDAESRLLRELGDLAPSPTTPWQAAASNQPTEES
jgi:hypothetical protein